MKFKKPPLKNHWVMLNFFPLAVATLGIVTLFWRLMLLCLELTGFHCNHHYKKTCTVWSFMLHTCIASLLSPLQLDLLYCLVLYAAYLQNLAAATATVVVVV